MFDFLYGWPWWSYAIAILLFMVLMPRVAGFLLNAGIILGLGSVVVICGYLAISTAGGMIIGSWRAHEASTQRVMGYDKPAYRAEIAGRVCPRYHDAGWFMRTFHADTRSLSWCADYE